MEFRLPFLSFRSEAKESAVCGAPHHQGRRSGIFFTALIG
jgi:hypothetical protein